MSEENERREYKIQFGREIFRCLATFNEDNRCTFFDSSTGGNGYINDYATGRLLRDAKLYEIGAGTNEIRRMVIGRAITEEYL